MLEDGYITAEPRRRRPRRRRSKRIATKTRQPLSAPYFAEEVRRELLRRYGEKGLYEGGLSVRTSLDPTLQAIADKALRDGLINYDRGMAGAGRSAISTERRGLAEKLAALPLPAGAGDWRLAVVTADEADGAAIALNNGQRGCIPFGGAALGEARAAGPACGSDAEIGGRRGEAR